MTNRFVKQFLVSCMTVLGVSQAAQAAICSAGFNNQGALRALPDWANDNFVEGDHDATPPVAPPPYKEPCAGAKSLWAGEDWVNPKYFHYHLGYENSCMNDAVADAKCGKGSGRVWNDCTDTCVDASLHGRKIGTHLKDHQLRFAMLPAPAKWCISRMTGNDVPANDANAVCSEYAGVKMAPLSVDVASSDARMYLWWKEKMGVSTPGGIRYTIVSRFTAVDLAKGHRIFSGYSRKYDLIRFTGIEYPIVLDNFTVEY